MDKLCEILERGSMLVILAKSARLLNPIEDDKLLEQVGHIMRVHYLFTMNMGAYETY